jgi:predicted transcriptional regulator
MSAQLGSGDSPAPAGRQALRARSRRRNPGQAAGKEQHDNRPMVPARVFATVLVAEDGRRTAAELAEQLGVSPAAISGAVRYLTQLRLVSREREPRQRVDHYRVSSDTWYEAITRRDEMVERWLQDLAEGVKSVGPGTAAGGRLEETRAFFEYLLQEIPGCWSDGGPSVCPTRPVTAGRLLMSRWGQVVRL